MKKVFLSLGLVFTAFIHMQSQSVFNKVYVKEVMDKVNKYQLANPWQKFDDNWIRGTYYTGVMACYQATNDQTYLDQCNKLCDELKWTLPTHPPNYGLSGANLLTIGQTMIESYMAKKKKYKIENIISHLNNPAIKNPVSNPLTWYFEGGKRYVDGLFTGPPTLAMLYSVTKDEKYLDWMESCFWDVYGSLIDPDEHLFYRDKRMFPMRTANDKKVIWSRGNGWAIAGIARILKYLPKEHGSYKRYELVMQTMAKALKARQSAEGFWYLNLEDSAAFPTKETSGTSFFIYGLAYGVNNGILDRSEYLPVIKKAWQSVCVEISEEGKVQWGQPVASRPVAITKEDSHEFVSGIFLLAASEMYKMNLAD